LTQSGFAPAAGPSPLVIQASDSASGASAGQATLSISLTVHQAAGRRLAPVAYRVV